MYGIYDFISAKFLKGIQGKETYPRSEDGMGVVWERWLIKVH